MFVFSRVCHHLRFCNLMAWHFKKKKKVFSGRFVILHCNLQHIKFICCLLVKKCEMFLSAYKARKLSAFQIVLKLDNFRQQQFEISTRFVFYIEFCLIFGSLALLNFSLALIISLISVPFILVFTLLANSRYDIWIFRCDDVRFRG